MNKPKRFNFWTWKVAFTTGVCFVFLAGYLGEEGHPGLTVAAATTAFLFFALTFALALASDD